MASKLTPLAVENAKPQRRGGAAVRTEIPDRGSPGLFLILQPTGVKSWALRYRVRGRSRKLTLGSADPATPDGLTLAAARVAAAQAQQRIAAGADPAAEKAAARATARQAHGDSIEDAVAQFLDLHVRRKLRPIRCSPTRAFSGG